MPDNGGRDVLKGVFAWMHLGFHAFPRGVARAADSGGPI
jgi:hypothetical protein